jgi:hypothetical protein
MKNLLLVMLAVFAFTALGQRVKSKFKSSLTDKEKQTYVLHADQNKISKARDTTFGDKRKWRYINPEITLSNLSDDTLNYINMTCSTYDIFTLNNKNTTIRGWGCDKNIPHEYKIPPHKNSTFNFIMYFDKNHRGKKFKFGIYLIRPETKQWGFGIMESFWKSKVPFKNCLIWSNDVTIPK